MYYKKGQIVLIDEKINDLQNLIKRKISYDEVAPILGLKSGTALRNWVYRKKPLKEFEIEKIDEAFGIKDFKKQQNTSTKETVAVDYFPEVFGSCGDGKFIVSEQKELIHVPKKFFSHYSPAKKYSVINAVGESMMPNIHPKDRLIVEHWAGEQIRDNQVYVFCYNNEIFVKRLIKNVDEVVIKSDNPDPAYRTRFIEKSDMNNLLIIGEIVGLMRDLR